MITSIIGSDLNHLDPDLPVEPDVGLPVEPGWGPCLLDPGPGAMFALPFPKSCPARPGLLELLTFPEFDPAPVSCPALPGLL